MQTSGGTGKKSLNQKLKKKNAEVLVFLEDFGHDDDSSIRSSSSDKKKKTKTIVKTFKYFLLNNDASTSSDSVVSCRSAPQRYYEQHPNRRRVAPSHRLRAPRRMRREIVRLRSCSLSLSLSLFADLLSFARSLFFLFSRRRAPTAFLIITLLLLCGTITNNTHTHTHTHTGP
jgi:hypothetical protein